MVIEIQQKLSSCHPTSWWKAGGRQSTGVEGLGKSTHNEVGRGTGSARGSVPENSI
jgi:hypothetical protein